MGSFLVCMRDSSTNRCRREYHLGITMFGVDSLVHGCSRNPYPRSLCIVKGTLAVVCLSVHLSIYR